MSFSLVGTDFETVPFALNLSGGSWLAQRILECKLLENSVCKVNIPRKIRNLVTSYFCERVTSGNYSNNLKVELQTLHDAQGVGMLR